MSSISQLIGSSEVVTTSELQERLVAEGRAPANARQAISRAARSDPDLWRSERLQLPRGERLIARAEFAKTRAFYRAVGARLKVARPGLSRCLDLLASDGVINRVHAHRMSGAPVIDGRSPSFVSEIAALAELGVTVGAAGLRHEYLSAADVLGTVDREQRALSALQSLRRDNLLARLVVDRLKKQNVLTWNGTDLPRGDKGYVTRNDQVFSATGFSYLAPLVRKNATGKFSPSLVLIDTFAGLCTLLDVQSFVARAHGATSRGQARQAFLGVIGARDFDEAAWKEARNQGLLAINFRQMFGDEALNAMAAAETILGSLGESQESTLSSGLVNFAEALESLKTNPVVADLCAIGFECLAGLVLRSEGWEAVALGQDVPFRGERTRDVDVFGSREDQLVMLECKAYHERKELTRDEVKKFFTETVPACREWWTQKEKRPPALCRAQIWTSGTVGEPAQEALKELSLGKGIEAALCGPADIAERLPPKLKSRAIGLMSALSKGGQHWTDRA